MSEPYKSQVADPLRWRVWWRMFGRLLWLMRLLRALADDLLDAVEGVLEPSYLGAIFRLRLAYNAVVRAADGRSGRVSDGALQGTGLTIVPTLLCGDHPRFGRRPLGLGCGQAIEEIEALYRCERCETAFHRACIRHHFGWPEKGGGPMPHALDAALAALRVTAVGSDSTGEER